MIEFLVPIFVMASIQYWDYGTHDLCSLPFILPPSFLGYVLYLKDALVQGLYVGLRPTAGDGSP